MGRGTLGAQQGMHAATAQQAKEAALRSHPETTKQVANHEMTGAQKLDWLKTVCPGMNVLRPSRR